MTIETKYNIGDEVWVVFSGNGVYGCAKCRVIDIEVKVLSDKPMITYRLVVPSEMDDTNLVHSEYLLPERYKERFVFPTKEELLKSL